MKRDGLQRGTSLLRAKIRARKFVRAYLAGPEGVRGNASQCARYLGSKAINGPSIAERGYEYMSHPEVKRLLARYMEREEITTQRLLHELAAVALARPSDVMDWDAEGIRVVKASRLLDDDTLAAIQEVESESTEQASESGVTKKTRVKVRLHDKVQAIKVLLQAKRAIGDDVPREFTLVIGKANAVQVNAGQNGGPGSVTLKLDGPTTNGDAPDDEKGGDA